MMMNDKLITMKIKPRPAKQAACGNGKKVTITSITSTKITSLRSRRWKELRLNLNLGSGKKRLLLRWNNPHVEDPRKDKDEAGG